ncbi:predicted protein [Plenodomus lingam JN3]|uniref:Predicted protein n=1 Tax=Leptosphaeria maculans (strain JN3 / isolate v23.1.3 / race Av1-4-5-6-7-8) TaxID=985895 RepID=E5A899_LEPMJ|nr:predicted protein [Plenodomus lingam JN3]CBX99844.1 predicted protein [Plenodomus lingam JN3]
MTPCLSRRGALADKSGWHTHGPNQLEQPWQSTGISLLASTPWPALYHHVHLAVHCSGGGMALVTHHECIVKCWTDGDNGHQDNVLSERGRIRPLGRSPVSTKETLTC